MLNVSLPQAIFLPPLLIVLASISLVTFQNLFSTLTAYATKYSSNDIIKTIKPGLVQVKNFLEHVLGKASAFKFNLQHVLLMVIVFVLIAIFNELAQANALKEKELKLLRAANKKTADDEAKKTK
ncbi:hypothetical protein SPRG_15418 [Saprolegnia parasitica CBS 223.65]|uniref:Uncharacterized protein n=1 Tax=Saprolegnia parasitica (strain CBS 223.65) TaxID=695850 RepID=A0A067BQW5_SAPPC|nr:hypothetical protein SPRG_15418 [Saprolegnia parasitica CBS 223.65]XP_012212611.1 hypothetical protein SPRG_17815 [Saprolegnia parasitica CBS 223.65]KDO16681.1 hypothetical protein SPRG_17815 [Saprolegnia parasitica CBS 223.65]KDO19428.1 hypothetical protein SPRG_15418 [Saprolegnia parasitica CBS 223.65]|eukprot:XP_012209854.1 hypothetical protein SPRG_15418 [Saprolegnia parasitica CBS 223.65]